MRREGRSSAEDNGRRTWETKKYSDKIFCTIHVELGNNKGSWLWLDSLFHSTPFKVSRKATVVDANLFEYLVMIKPITIELCVAIRIECYVACHFYA